MSVAEDQVSAAGEVSRYRWVVMLMWMASHVWGFVILESLGFLLPSIREDMGLTPIQEGFLGAAPRIGNMILAIPAGWLLSRFRPKPLTSVCLFLAAGLVFFQGWSPIFIVLIIGRFLYGTVSIAREPARVLLMRQWIPNKEIVVVNAMANLLFGIVAIGFILTPIVLRLLDNSWRNTYFVFGGVSITMAIAWQVVGRERVTSEYETEFGSQQASPLGTILRYRELWLMGLGMLGVGINFSAISTFWPSYMLDQYGMSLTRTATLVAIGGGFSSVAGIGMGLLVRRIGRKRQVLSFAGILLAVSSVGLLWTGSYPILLLIQIANALGWTFFPITMTIPFELSEIKPREVAVAVSFQQSLIWLGAFIGPILAVTIHEASGDLRLALMVTSFATVAMTAGALLLPRRWDQRTMEQQPVRT
ncbi:MAG: nitrate/nitrite transporter [Dehalococcoidia bacterium]